MQGLTDPDKDPGFILNAMENIEGHKLSCIFLMCFGYGVKYGWRNWVIWKLSSTTKIETTAPKSEEKVIKYDVLRGNGGQAT